MVLPEYRSAPGMRHQVNPKEAGQRCRRLHSEYNLAVEGFWNQASFGNRRQGQEHTSLQHSKDVDQVTNSNSLLNGMSVAARRSPAWLGELTTIRPLTFLSEGCFVG